MARSMQVIGVTAKNVEEARALAGAEACELPMFFGTFHHRPDWAQSAEPPPEKDVVAPLLGMTQTASFRALNVRIPGIAKVIELAVDWWGDKTKRCQIIHHDERDEMSVALRYDAEGKLVEVWVAEDVRVVRGNAESPWQKERDAE